MQHFSEIPNYPAPIPPPIRNRRSFARFWSRSVYCPLASSCARPAAALRDLSIVVRVRIGNHVPYFSRAHLDLEVRGEPLEVLGGDRVPLIRVEQREDLS